MISPNIQTMMLFVMLAIALARALIYLVTLTPATLNMNMPKITIIPRPIRDGFYLNWVMYEVNPYI